MTTNISLNINNDQRWQLQARFTKEGAFLQLSDQWSDIPLCPVYIVLREIFPKDYKKSVSFLLQKRIEKLCAYKNPFGFQVYKHRDCLFVVFGKYGLAGGGNTAAMIGSFVQAGVGAILVGTGVGAIPGGILLSSGVSSGLYAHSAKEELTFWNYSKNAAIGAVSGLVSGGVSCVGGWIFGQGAGVVSSLVNAGASQAAGRAAQIGMVEGAEGITGKKLLASAAGGVFGAAGSVVGGAVAVKCVGKAAHGIADAVLKGTVKGATESTVSTLCGTVTENLVNGEEWNEHLGESLVLGVGASVVSSAMATTSRGSSHLQLESYQEALKTCRPKKESRPFSSDFANRGGVQRLAEINTAYKAVMGQIDRNEERAQLKKELYEKTVTELQVNGDAHCLSAMPEEERASPFYVVDICDSSVVPADHLTRLFAMYGSRHVFLTWQELAEHIVLVHALSPQVGQYFLEEMEKEYYNGILGNARLVAEKAITKDGTLGSHLDFSQAQFKDGLIQRPHIHWAWNQVVQANGGGSWNNASIVILEPLSAFENGEHSSVFNIAPYDTCTIGSHRLSENAIVLVPKDVEEAVRTHLTSPAFRGKIISYEAEYQDIPNKNGFVNCSLRTAVVKALDENYPEIWHLVDASGGRIGEKDYSASLEYDRASGCFKTTCLQKKDGSRLILISGNGEGEDKIHSRAVKEGRNSGKFIGLHIHSDTYCLEVEGSYFDHLMQFKENPERHIQNRDFAFNCMYPKSLGILKAIKFQHAINKYSLQTRVGEYGNYLLKEAIAADMTSILQGELKEKIVFTRHEWALMVNTYEERILELLQQLSSHLQDEGVSRDIFERYKALLKEAVVSMKATKEFLVRSKKKKNSFPWLDSLLRGDNLYKEWACVQKIAQGTKFDRDPQTQEEKDLLEKIRGYLPQNVNLSELQMALQFVNALAVENEQQEVRKKYIASSLKLYITEIHYIKAYKAKSDPTQVYPYDLEREDATNLIGNCLFDNVVYQLFPEDSQRQRQERSFQLRMETALYMRNHPQEFENFFIADGELFIGNGIDRYEYKTWDEYTRYLQRDLVWADELVIQALSTILGRSVIVMTQGQQQIQIYHSEQEQGEPLFIAHEHGNHFISLMMPEGITQREMFERIMASQPH